MNLQGWRYYVVGHDPVVGEMMNSVDAVRSGLKDADIVVFTGGTDISPTIYGEQILHSKTQRPDTARDNLEVRLYNLGLAKRKTLVGICRGAQLLNCLNGGKLFQHVDGHVGTTHGVRYTDRSGDQYDIVVTSDHHQMMRPGEGSKVIGYAKKSTERNTALAKFFRRDEEIDPEIVWYPLTKTLCYQPHPEWGLSSDRNCFVDCVRRTLTG